MSEGIKCLPECDERHADGCPVFEAEREYWRKYLGVGTPAFENFRPEFGVEGGVRYRIEEND